MYVLTLANVMSMAEIAAHDKSKVVAGKGSKPGAYSGLDWGHLKSAMLENMKVFVGLNLSRIFDSASEKETVIK